MKQYTMYVCETCGYESRDAEDVRKHEASHLGLTLELSQRTFTSIRH